MSTSAAWTVVEAVVERPVDSFGLVEHLLLLAKQDGHGRTIEPLPATAD